MPAAALAHGALVSAPGAHGRSSARRGSGTCRSTGQRGCELHRCAFGTGRRGPGGCGRSSA
eukprot:2244905-Alexandrium_andersonii.AAC.1